jgi:hypothetical protein
MIFLEDTITIKQRILFPIDHIIITFLQDLIFELWEFQDFFHGSLNLFHAL